MPEDPPVSNGYSYLLRFQNINRKRALFDTALRQLLRLEVVTKRVFLAKNDARRRAVSKYDAWAMHPPKNDTTSDIKYQLEKPTASLSKKPSAGARARAAAQSLYTLVSETRV